MAIIFTIINLVALTLFASNALADASPCKIGYEMVCGQEVCTCVTTNIGEVIPKLEIELTSRYDGHTSYGPDETLEAVPSFVPEDTTSACTIGYTLLMRSLSGEILETHKAVLNAAEPFVIHERKSMDNNYDKRHRMRLSLSGKAENCTVGEFQSFSTNIATYHGRSGKTISQNKLDTTITFTGLEEGELPPILPADSTLGIQTDCSGDDLYR